MATQQWDSESDMVVVGASSGGLVSAIIAHDLGMSVTVLEKATDTIGGGTVFSPGTLWIPCNDHMSELGVVDTREQVLTYVRAISMGRHEEDILTTYVDRASEMLRQIERCTPLQVRANPGNCDYRAELPGAKMAGRKVAPDLDAVTTTLIEGQKRYPLLAKVRSEPVPYFAGSPSMAYNGGRALIACLVLAVLERKISIVRDSQAHSLIRQGRRVIGLKVRQDGRDVFMRGKRGVVLASGGYEWNGQMNKRYMACPDIHAVTPPTNEGNGHVMGMEIGAAVALMDHSLVLPTVRIPGEEIDRKPLYRLFMACTGKPGSMVVNREGKRCCNESFYPDVGRALLAYDAARSAPLNQPMFWVGDQSIRDRERLGPLPQGTEMADWLSRADSISELAASLHIPAHNLQETVQRFNSFARKGQDPDFHRGESIYDTSWWGYPGHSPNPVLGPLENPPFYGVLLHPGTVGHLGGLVTDSNARVISARDEAIPGLYATSNTSAMLVSGYGYDSGMCQGKSMTFGYLAARHMANA